jgi:glucose-1-phosphate thymidylyltransferase
VTPKPLLRIAGKSIVERIVEELKDSSGRKFDEIHFVIGNFGEEVERSLINISRKVGAEPFIHYQDCALGTAHAISCAAAGLQGEVIVAFADTLFIGKFTIENSDEAIIWTKEVDNPENYGVVVTDSNKMVTRFVEKPDNHISDRAIIGIYYLKKGEVLSKTIGELIDDKAMVNGEYQLTDALERMMKNNIRFSCKTIDKWLDCGNKEQFLNSAFEILKRTSSDNEEYRVDNEILEPVYFGKGVKIKNCKIGPNVLIEDYSALAGTTISNSIVGTNSIIENSELSFSMLGSYNRLIGSRGIFNLGDFNSYEAR